MTTTPEISQDMDRLNALIDEVRSGARADSHLITVLHKAQELWGYLDEEVLRHVAERMKLPLSRVWGVATFYHYFKLVPQGRHIISVCMGTACYVNGAQNVVAAMKEHLGIEVGETTRDRMFTLLETRCLGACGQAPVVMINDKMYGKLTPGKAVDVLVKLRKES